MIRTKQGMPASADAHERQDEVLQTPEQHFQHLTRFLEQACYSATMHASMV